MMSKLAVAAALAVALIGTAFAQTPAPPTQTPQGQAQQSQAPQDKDQQRQGPQDKAQQNQGLQDKAQQSTTTGVATPAQAQVLSAIPNNTTTITSYYKKNVYDRSDAKIGEITDVLVDKDGKIDGFMMAVGGFLGLGEKKCGGALRCR
jgi:hypothetical protein